MQLDSPENSRSSSQSGNFSQSAPESVRSAENLLSRDQAIRNLHFPESENFFLPHERHWHLKHFSLSTFRSPSKTKLKGGRKRSFYSPQCRTYKAVFRFSAVCSHKFTKKIAILKFLKILKKLFPCVSPFRRRCRFRGKLLLRFQSNSYSSSRRTGRIHCSNRNFSKATCRKRHRIISKF